MERISTLLSHYWTANEPPELRRLQLSDWMEDLGEFSASYVAMAIKEWRQGEHGKRRPTPVEIRTLTIAAVRASKPQKKEAPVALMIEGPRDDYRREPKPAPDVVRPDWMRIRYPDLTAAEQDLCRQWNRRSIEGLSDSPFRALLLAMTEKKTT